MNAFIRISEDGSEITTFNFFNFFERPANVNAAIEMHITTTTMPKARANLILKQSPLPPAKNLRNQMLKSELPKRVSTPLESNQSRLMKSKMAGELKMTRIKHLMLD